MNRVHIRLWYEDGQKSHTFIDPKFSDEQIYDFFLNRQFNLGQAGRDYRVRCTGCQIIRRADP
ncbi:MAG: hypothetical protein JAY71_19380 [Candidatus Thiodiazotropha weberae]|nr:hypothetical protein [Candidatus Thiodiazotropha weberae]